MLEIDKLNKENMTEIEPRSVYYAASIKSFLKDGKILESGARVPVYYGMMERNVRQYDLQDGEMI